MVGSVRWTTWGIAAALALTVAGGASAKTKLTWMSWAKDADLTRIEGYIAEFEKQNPDIDIEYVFTAWDQIPTRLPVQVAGGVAPDLVTISSSWGYSLAEQGLLLDLTPLIVRDRVRDKAYDFDDIFPALWNAWQLPGGAQYALPDSVDVSAIYYNVDLLEESGLVRPADRWTWNDLLVSASRLTRDTDGDGTPDQFGFSHWFFDWFAFVYANGGSVLTPDTKQSAMNTPAARQAVEYYAQFWPARRHAIPAAAEPGGNNPDAHFQKGKVGFQPVGPWYSIVLTRANAGFAYDVANMPVSPAGKRATMLAGSGFGIVKSTKNVEAAWRFVKFMTSKDILMRSTQETGNMTIRRSVMTSDAFLKNPVPPRNKKVWVDTLTYAVPYPKTIKWNAIRTQVFRQFNPYFLGNISLDEAITKFAEQVEIINKQ